MSFRISMMIPSEPSQLRQQRNSKVRVALSGFPVKKVTSTSFTFSRCHISTTFYEQLFSTKVLCAVFRYLCTLIHKYCHLLISRCQFEKLCLVKVCQQTLFCNRLRSLKSTNFAYDNTCVAQYRSCFCVFKKNKIGKKLLIK